MLIFKQFGPHVTSTDAVLYVYPYIKNPYIIASADAIKSNLLNNLLTGLSALIREDVWIYAAVSHIN